MTQDNRPIAILARRMFPAFVHDYHPMMITFMEKVIEKMSQDGEGLNVIQHLLENRTIDTTLTKFEDAFKNEYLANFPDTLTSDVALIVKNIRGFYLNKGTEESFKFLFGAMFGSTVNFKYPKFNIFRASDNEYYTPLYIVLADQNDNVPPRLQSGSAYSVTKLADKFITGAQSGAVAYIEGSDSLADVGLTWGNRSAVEAVRIVEKEGQFVAGEAILVGDTIIENGDFNNGTNFWEKSIQGDPDTFTIDGKLCIVQTIDNVIPKYTSQKITVEPNTRYWLRFSMTSADAGQTRVSVGYSPDSDPAEIYNTGNLGTSPVTPSPVLLLPTAEGKTEIYVTIWNEMATAGARCYYDGISLVKENTANMPLLFVANRQPETFTDLVFADANPDTITSALGDFTTLFTGATSIETTNSVSNVGTFPVATVSQNVITLGNAAALTNDGPQTGTVSRYVSGIMNGIPTWKDNRGFLSEGDVVNNREIVLADGWFYQDFSYQITSQVSSDKFVSIVKDLIHPAGFKLFGKVVQADIMESMMLRESNYSDITIDGSGIITRTSTGTPFNRLFRTGDHIRLQGFSETGNVDLNEGVHVVDTVSPTAIQVLAPFSTAAGSYGGRIVKIGAGMGMPVLDQTEFIEYNHILEFAFPEKIAAVQNDNFEIDHSEAYGFGETYANAEKAREPNGIVINSWSALDIGWFESFANSRFGFISSAEITIT